MPDPKAKVIDGTSFMILQPYETGQTIGEAEAKALNQVRAENVGNNTRAKIKEMKKEGKSEDEIAALVADYDKDYELTVSNVGASRSLDPVEKEARAIAKELIKQHLAETGRKLTVPPEGETKESWKEKVDSQIETLSENDEILKVAKKNVEEAKKKSEKLAESIGAIKIG